MKNIFLQIFIVVSASQLIAQTGVNISPSPIPADPSAILNVQSQNQGVLLPRTTTGSIVNPTDGLIIFDTVVSHYMFYDQNQWTKLLKASAFNFYYADRDGDDHGDPFSAIYAMTILDGYVASNGDCNDMDATIFSGAEEVCDMIDNNCNGSIDENCALIEWCNLQFPPTINIMPGAQTPNIFGQVFSTGITEAAGQGAGIIGQVGYGFDGENPSSGGWTWVTATYNADVGNNDEYMGSFSAPATIGNYDYAYRFSGDGGTTWTYGDLDGSTNGYSSASAGQLTVF